MVPPILYLHGARGRTPCTYSHGGKDEPEIVSHNLGCDFWPGGASPSGKDCLRMGSSGRRLDSALLVVMGRACRRRDSFDLGVPASGCQVTPPPGREQDLTEHKKVTPAEADKT